MTIHTDSSRRRFFFSAGAALSAPLALGTAGAADRRPSTTAADKALRDIHDLQQSFAREINAGKANRAARYFVRATDIADLTDVRRIVPADFGERDLVEIAPDGFSAHARFHCTVETQTAIEAKGTLVEMARQQGEGFICRLENRMLEADYVMRDGHWRIERLSFRGV